MRKPLDTIWLLYLLVACLGILASSGCGGGSCVSKGCVVGYVYTSAGGDVIISGSDTPPAGYEPVIGAEVYIEGHPDLQTRTDENGYYYIQGVPTGSRTVIVEALGTQFRFTVPVRAGRCTSGGGHSEGGGGL